MTNLDYLVSLAKLGNLGHAYVLSGNDKEGKEHAIVAFCEFLLGSGAHHGDLHIIDSESKEISIGQIRDLRLVLALGAWNSPYKIAVIRHAHLMNQEAQSAFLKLLEEPKGSAVFLLETDHVFLLLATIRSRAQEIRFWKFPSYAEHISEETQKSFDTLASQPLYKRFSLAKTLAESREETQQFLAEFIAYLRLQLKRALPTYNISSLLRLVKLSQETSSLLQTTNVSTRIALERLLFYAKDKV